MSTIKKVFFVTILLFTSIFAGCISLDGLYVDPSFTYQSVVQNNIGVAGVVSAANKISSAQQTSLSNLLQNSLISHFNGQPVMPAGDAVRALGSERYQAMMEYYRLHGVVPNQYLTALYNHIFYMRYVVFVRVEQNNISNQREQNDDVPTTPGMSTANINFITTLSLRVHVDVYDLNMHTIVWRGSYSDSDSSSNQYEVPSMVAGPNESANRAVTQSMLGMMGSAMVDANHTYPTAPSFDNLMQKMFNNIVNQFPKNVMNS